MKFYNTQHTLMQTHAITNEKKERNKLKNYITIMNRIDAHTHNNKVKL